MADIDRLWATIPISEANAEGATAIWVRYELGARATTHHQLNRLTAEGRIKRISRPMPNGGEVHLYYRSANDADAAAAGNKISTRPGHDQFADQRVALDNQDHFIAAL